MFFAKCSLQIKHNYIYSRGNSVPIFDFLKNIIAYANYITQNQYINKINSEGFANKRSSTPLKNVAFENSLIHFLTHRFYYRLLCPSSSKTCDCGSFLRCDKVREVSHNRPNERV